MGFLRFIGVVNAAIWFGGSVVCSLVMLPGFFTGPMKAVLPPPYNGAAAQVIIERYFWFQHICAAVALLHLWAERLYTNRAGERITASVLAILFGLGLAGGFWLQPKLQQLYLAKYRAPSAEQRAEAAADFRTWHAVSRVADTVMLPALLFYLWRLTSASHPSRLPGFRKLSVGWK